MQFVSSGNFTVHYQATPWADEFPLTLLKRNPGIVNTNRLHYHSGLEIGICYEGRGLFIIHNEIVPFESGDMIIVPADHPHVVVSRKEDPSYWEFVMVDSERLFHNMGVTDYEPIDNILRGKEHIPNFIKNNTHDDLRETLKQIIFEVKNLPPKYQLTSKALLWAFLLKLTRLKYIPENDLNAFQTHSFALISPAINFITNNYSQEISVDMLFEMCFLSRSHFERVFKKVMQHTPLEYLKSVRIRMATIMLKTTDRPILDIATEVGYHSVSSFNRQFLQFKKCTPREYRNKYR